MFVEKVLCFTVHKLERICKDLFCRYILGHLCYNNVANFAILKKQMAFRHKSKTIIFPICCLLYSLINFESKSEMFVKYVLSGTGFRGFTFVLEHLNKSERDA